MAKKEKEPKKPKKEKKAKKEKKPASVDQLREVISEMSMGRRLAIMVAAAAIMAGFISLLLWVNAPSYQVLYTGLSQKDAAAVVDKLKELKVPFKIEGNGALIKVPENEVYEARLSMASAGLPRGGGVGFEIFNEVQMGTTEFVQKINYQRALQGELARTIASFPEVEEVRVHIVMPRDSLFVEEDKQPSAAVVLRLAAGRSLTKRQVKGVVYLVASSVPDLRDDHVTVVDANGNLLYRKDTDTGDFAAAQTASQLEYQKTLEGGLRSKIQSMLEEVLGLGRAVVRVSADIDFTRTSTVEDLFNPDQVAVRSETRRTEKSKNAGPGPIGSPDNRFSLAQRNASPGLAGSKTGSSTENENETTNFEISRTKKQTTRALAGLKRLNVAVMVDGPYKVVTSADGQTTRTFTPRSPEEMRQLTELVRRAVGYDEKRGDQVTLANVPFALPVAAGMQGAKGWRDYLDEYGRPALNLVLAVLFFLMVVRPMIRYLTAKAKPPEAVVGARAVGPGEELPPGEEGVTPEMLAPPPTPRKLGPRDAILTLAQQDPERTTAVLRSWIHET